ncbi:MAG: redoxin domain-containing protein [Pirellulaceae bacterium]
MLRNLHASVALCIGSCLIGTLWAESTATPNWVGKAVDSFSLKDTYGKQHALSDYADKDVVVLLFLGTECPLVKLYSNRLNQLAEEYADKSVALIGVNANSQDSITEMQAFINRHKLTFPWLKDTGNQLADQLGAVRTPEVFVLDRERTVRYWGRIDDQFGIGYLRDKPEHNYLTDAIDACLAGKPVAVAQTESVGCYIGRVIKVEPQGEITYSQHVAPIFNQRCVECHREGQIAPFTLTSYDDTVGWGETIMEVIDENRMPPWNANPEHGSFQNDARLSPAEKDVVFQWIENGMPEGNPADLPAPPEFAEGWRIDVPDQVIHMRESKQPFAVPADGVVEYQYFTVDPGWDEDKYITAAEAKPGNTGVVHHIIAFVWPPGAERFQLDAMLVGYAPGAPPTEFKDGAAMFVPAGSKLVFEMHYTPNGSPQEDLSYVGVNFTTKDKVLKIVKGGMTINTDFAIPPKAANHQVEAGMTFARDHLLLSMSPHMHLRGKAFTYEAIYPDGNKEILLDVPNYDFNWQLTYQLAEPKLMPAGTKLRCLATFDNSQRNLSNPDPTDTVRWGQQSWEEMMIGFFTTMPAPLANAPAASVDPSGTWKWSLPGRQGTSEHEIKVNLVEPNRLSGEYTGLGIQRDLQSGHVYGDRIQFDVPIVLSGRQLTAVFDGQVQDNQITGQIILESGFGGQKLPWNAKKVD